MSEEKEERKNLHAGFSEMSKELIDKIEELNKDEGKDKHCTIMLYSDGLDNTMVIHGNGESIGMTLVNSFMNNEVFAEIARTALRYAEFAKGKTGDEIKSILDERLMEISKNTKNEA
jgi:hypothetical protein